MKSDKLETVCIDQLARVTGGAGFDMSQIGPLIQQAGSMADSAGAGGQGSKIAGMIGPLVSQFANMKSA
jgi:hypothetical protein